MELFKLKPLRDEIFLTLLCQKEHKSRNPGKFIPKGIIFYIINLIIFEPVLSIGTSIYDNIFTYGLSINTEKTRLKIYGFRTYEVKIFSESGDDIKFSTTDVYAIYLYYIKEYNNFLNAVAYDIICLIYDEENTKKDTLWHSFHLSNLDNYSDYLYNKLISQWGSFAKVEKEKKI